MSYKTNRRNFLLGSAAMLTTLGCRTANQTQSIASPTTTDFSDAPMPERTFGRTQVQLPLLGLGGSGRKTPLSKPDREAEAIALVEAALTLGIRYFDTANNYGDSEAQLGRVLPTHRDRIYINTKTDARDYDGAWRHLETSLERLKTDYLDGWQLHHVSFQEELDRIFSPTGAFKAFLEAKEQKIVRFLGITGHHEPDVIAEGLRRYEFDTALVTLNAADLHHPRPFSTTVLPIAQEKNVGVVAMKVPSYGRLLQPHLINIEQAMGYSLSLPGVHSCVIAAEDPAQLAANVAVARGYQRLSAQEMEAIVQRTAGAGDDGAFFRRWT